jgi:hypothetical protein
MEAKLTAIPHLASLSSVFRCVAAIAVLLIALVGVAEVLLRFVLGLGNPANRSPSTMASISMPRAHDRRAGNRETMASIIGVLTTYLAVHRKS